jgi:dolichol kinase
MVFASFVVFAVVASAAVALFMYWSIHRREARDIWPVVATIAVSGIITAVAYSQYLILSWFFFMCVAVASLAAMLPVLYRRRPMAFMLAIFIIAYAMAISFDRMATVGMFGVGTIIGALYGEHYLSTRREDRTMRKTATETRRDMVQMVIGLGVLAVMLVLQQGYLYIIFALVLLAYLFNNLISKNGAAFRELSRLERRDVEYGTGAMHIAAGLAILLGFAGYKLALFGVFPLFFGDALATLTGMHFYRSRKLPYNRRKSYAGTIGFLIATIIPGVIILGLWGIPLALVLTLIESVELPIDDNIAVPIATVVLGALFGLG